MNKYESLYTDVYSIFAAAGWLAENIKTFPDNFVGNVAGDEYIRVSIIASGAEVANFIRSVSGQMIIDIFIPAGGGPTRAAQIADKLDKYLAGQSSSQTANGGTQFFASSMIVLGNDKANPALYRAQYSIPFNFYGV